MVPFAWKSISQIGARTTRRKGYSRDTFQRPLSERVVVPTGNLASGRCSIQDNSFRAFCQSLFFSFSIDWAFSSWLRNDATSLSQCWSCKVHHCTFRCRNITSVSLSSKIPPSSFLLAQATVLERLGSSHMLLPHQREQLFLGHTTLAECWTFSMPFLSGKHCLLHHSFQ